MGGVEHARVGPNTSSNAVLEQLCPLLSRPLCPSKFPYRDQSDVNDGSCKYLIVTRSQETNQHMAWIDTFKELTKHKLIIVQCNQAIEEIYFIIK